MMNNRPGPGPGPQRPMPAPARVAPLGAICERLREIGDPVADVAEALLAWTEIAQSIALTRFPDAPLGSRAHLDVSLALLGHLVTLAGRSAYEQGDDYEDEEPRPDEAGAVESADDTATATSYDP